MSKGKLIVIEGLDGSGKATQTNILTEKLEEKEFTVKKVSFPNYKNPSSALVKMYLNGELGKNPNDVNAYAASSFYAVDRYVSYKKFWQADYESGCCIIADRYATSNAIYQLSKIDRDKWNEFIEWIEFYEYKQLELPKPDLTIYLDVPVEVSQRLITNRYNGDESKKDLHEGNLKFLSQCRETALYSANKLGWNIIDCSKNGQIRTVEDIHNDIINIVEEILK